MYICLYVYYENKLSKWYFFFSGLFLNSKALPEAIFIIRPNQKSCKNKRHLLFVSYVVLS